MNNLKRRWVPGQDVVNGQFAPCSKIPRLEPPDPADYLDISSETNYAPLTPENRVQNDDVVCYGALYEGRVSHRGRKASFQKFCRSAGSLERFSVSRKHESCFTIKDQAQNDFAVLDMATATALDGLEGLENITFQAVPQPLIGNQPSPSQIIDVSINIYGPMRHYREVGSRLSRLKYNLQHPDAIDSGVRYDNPHYFKRSSTHLEMQQFIGPVYNVERTLQSVYSEVKRLLDTLDAVDSPGDIPATEKLLTPLLAHQQTAVKFIRSREDFEKAREWYQLTESPSLQIPFGGSQNDRLKQSTGGIIADTMGLGKTFTMLSAIVLSLEEAAEFMQSTDRCFEGNHCVIPTKSTLVIVPSTQLFDVWISEMERHIAPNSMRLLIFHGPQKKLDAKDYLTSDIVLTTYSTLASDCQTIGILRRLKWFRIVLDEAHWIRTPASKQFRAVTQLQACRRWCLTGTPIQNKLEDLGALVAFLKTPPFDDRSQTRFKQHIIDPLFSGMKDPSQNLRLLLQSLCLRRTKHSSQNITVNTELIKLSLSAAERTAYDEILEKTKQEMDHLVSSNLEARKYTKLFTAMHLLRVLCVQGTACRSWNSRSSSPTQPFEINGSEPRCEICDDEFTQSFKAECSFCPGCSRLLSDPPSSGGYFPGHLMLDSTGAHQTPLSPSSYSSLSPSTEPTLSTKLQSLLNNLIQHASLSKSIVFSAWTKTLDILCMKLEELGLNHVRIDGDVSRLDRTRRLHDFQTSPSIPILLMTYGTGAVGLNLTAANRIHILEPQWNPSVEEQAIGRAVRLGQSREVTVVKYVAERTVEENILAVQRNKQQLASLTLAGDSIESLSNRTEELKRILFISR